MLRKLFGNLFTENHIERFEGQVQEINALEEEIKKINDTDLLEESRKLKQEIGEGTIKFENALPKGFALVREAARRTLGQRHFDVQLMGGIALFEGKIAEMRTGEGKTLTATLPVYLHALLGKGAHVITVNDYLARRDTVWMGQIYHALGLTVSCVVHGTAYQYDPSFEAEPEVDEERDTVASFRVVQKFLRPITRKEAYGADVTYGTNHEFGFDFLRDNLVPSLVARVQRKHYYALIDEVDSILIDEARTPLIIAEPDTESSDYYKIFSKIVQRLMGEEDYTIDEKLRIVNITEAGIEKVEKALNIPNIFDPQYARLVHYLQECLKAETLFKRDKDYVARNGEIIIIDEFTGRMLMGRRYSGGLHQAIEAKEGVQVKQENKTLAQITIQNYFRLYEKIAGMTGTAQTSAEEFHKVYNLDVVTIPPNKPIVREDVSDIVYKTKEAKYRAIVEDIKKRNEKGQPILIGTTSISNNELISSYLHKANIPHEILNAKNHEREGEIIAQAGRKGAVTVATNMAGRGVDIVLGGNPPVFEEAQKICEVGGLHVIGTERHEARRIDNQLRGRSGRQGDPGSTQFFLSLEDDLMRIFGGERIQKIMTMLNAPEDMPIESNIVSKAINQAQTKVEGANLDLRRHLLDFDDVLNKQRTAMYAKRTKFLEAAERNEILPTLRETLEGFAKRLRGAHEKASRESAEERERYEKELGEIEEKLKKIPESLEADKAIVIGQQMVRILDMLWIEHLTNLESLRESVNIRAYGQHEPIVEYRREAHLLFRRLEAHFDSMLFQNVFPLFEMDMKKFYEQAQQAVARSAPRDMKIGRNDPCYCGSGKKYKKCHGK